MRAHDPAVCRRREQCSGAWQVHVSPSKQILPFYHLGLVCSGFVLGLEELHCVPAAFTALLSFLLLDPFSREVWLSLLHHHQVPVLWG